MSTTYAQTGPTVLPATASAFTVPLLLSLLGLALSAAILPHCSDATINVMFSSIGFG
jgi:hypothetical protein